MRTLTICLLTFALGATTYFNGAEACSGSEYGERHLYLDDLPDFYGVSEGFVFSPFIAEENDLSSAQLGDLSEFNLQITVSNDAEERFEGAIESIEGSVGEGIFVWRASTPLAEGRYQVQLSSNEGVLTRTLTVSRASESAPMVSINTLAVFEEEVKSNYECCDFERCESFDDIGCDSRTCKTCWPTEYDYPVNYQLNISISDDPLTRQTVRYHVEMGSDQNVLEYLTSHSEVSGQLQGELEEIRCFKLVATSLLSETKWESEERCVGEAELTRLPRRALGEEAFSASALESWNQCESLNDFQRNILNTAEVAESEAGGCAQARGLRSPIVYVLWIMGLVFLWRRRQPAATLPSPS